MFRPAFLPTPRSGALLVAGAVVAASALAGAASAQAATPVADLETTVLRIAGPPVSGTTIPAGTSLTPVRLTTSDPETVAGDGGVLVAGQPEVRSKNPRFVLPAVPAETATFGINGVVVATSVPALRAAWLQTDQGPVGALVFTAGGVSYAIPQLNVSVGAVSRTVASSTVNTSTVTSLITYQYSLLPVGAQPRVGTTFQQSTYGATVLGSGTAPFTVYDADAIRGNSDAAAEELVLLGMTIHRVESTFERARSDAGDIVDEALRGDFDELHRPVVAHGHDMRTIDGVDRIANPIGMRAIEEKIDIPESRKDDFRRELMNYIGALAIEGKQFDYKMNERLHRALELKLFEDQRDTIKLTTIISNVVDKQTQEKIEVVKSRLMKNFGYCEICATDALNFVASIFAKGDSIKS